MLTAARTMPRFISFEGLDGAGKSTHIAWLADLLTSRGKTVVRTREPGGTPIGERLRAMALTHELDVNAEILLMFAARRQHLTEVIEPALAQGKVVITDRFADSSYAFQGGGRDIPDARVRVLDEWCGGPRPDLTFVFDLPVEVAMSRIAPRGELDRFEQEDRAFHERVREAFQRRAAAEPRRIRVIDATRSVAEIRGELAAAVESAQLNGGADSAYDGLRTFADVRAMLDEVATHKALCALNDAVEEQFMRDRQQLAMTDADWEQWTVLVAHKAAQIEDRGDGATPRERD